MISIRSFIPNTITCLNLVAGSMACIAAFSGAQIGAWGLTGYRWAFVFIALAAVFDFMDGAMARMLHAYSLVGKELDSLSDLVSFGLAPALLIYNYICQMCGDPWWAYLSLWIAVMGAVRLARFNVDTRQTTSFIGLPIPANALFWIGALSYFIESNFDKSAVLIALVLLFPLLMVSNLPLFSLKISNVALRDNWARYLLIVAAVCFLVFCGVAGLTWTILFYIALSMFVGPRRAA